jgi:replicative DNA helicase
MRLQSMHSGITVNDQEQGQLEVEEWERYNSAHELIATYDMTLNDLASMTIAGIKHELHRLKHKPDIVIVDYLQLMGVDGQYDRRDQELGEMSRGCKQIAKDYNIPVIAAAQLSRKVEERGDKRPVLADLRESGNLEQDADVVIFLYRDEQYNSEAVHGLAEAIVAKQRSGATGTVQIYFVAERTTFTGLETRKVSFNEK